jgi:rhamnosyltransferase
MKILAIVITYNPSIDDLITNISSFINFVDRLIIWDNSPTSCLKSFFLDKKIEVFTDGQNRGIAYPINQVVNIVNSSNENYTHLLTMDQDSTWLNFSYYVNEISSFCDDNTIFSPNINKEFNVSNCKKEVNYCITSGAIFTKNVLKKIGFFNEEYSVDCVDYDFCFKAKNNGVKILKILGAELLQNYGVEKKHRIFRFRVNEYSPKRLYFIVRNHIFLFKDYPQNFDFRLFFMSFKNYFLFKIPKILLMESNKLDKIKCIFKGLNDGFKNDRSQSYQ